MGLRDSIKRATGGTPDRPVGTDGVEANGGGRERSGSFGNLLGGSHIQDKRKSVDNTTDGDDTEVLDEGEGNVLLSLISQRKWSVIELILHRRAHARAHRLMLTHTLSPDHIPLLVRIGMDLTKVRSSPCYEWYESCQPHVLTMSRPPAPLSIVCPTGRSLFPRLY